MSDSLWPHGLQHTRLPCPSPTPRSCPNSCPQSTWYYPTISSSVVPFSCLQFFPASGSFQMSVLCIRWLKYWSFSSTSVLPISIQDWFPLGLTGLISLKSEGLSRVLSSTTVQKHQFFSVQLSAILPSSVLTGCPGTIRESNTWRETRCYMTHPWEGRSRFWKKLTTKATA